MLDARVLLLSHISCALNGSHTQSYLIALLCFRTAFGYATFAGGWSTRAYICTRMHTRAHPHQDVCIMGRLFVHIPHWSALILPGMPVPSNHSKAQKGEKQQSQMFIHVYSLVKNGNFRICDLAWLASMMLQFSRFTRCGPWPPVFQLQGVDVLTLCKLWMTVEKRLRWDYFIWTKCHDSWDKQYLTSIPLGLSLCRDCPNNRVGRLLPSPPLWQVCRNCYKCECFPASVDWRLALPQFVRDPRCLRYILVKSVCSWLWFNLSPFCSIISTFYSTVLHAGSHGTGGFCAPIWMYVEAKFTTKRAAVD